MVFGYKSHECTHMMVIVILLQVSIFVQYGLCDLNCGYKRSEHPTIGVGLCVVVVIGALSTNGLSLILAIGSLATIGLSYPYS
jgi:hypothetical protein